MDKLEEFFGVVEMICAKERVLEIRRSKMDLSHEEVLANEGECQSIEYDVDMLYHDLPILTFDEWNKLDEWQKAQLIEYRICPFCHGHIGTYPITEVNYTIECDQCNYLFEEE